MTTWINFLGKYSKKHNMKLGDAMKPASKEWKKVKKNGGNHCNQNPEDVLKNPTKTVLPNCTRKYRRHRKSESKKGGEGNYPYEIFGVEMGGEPTKKEEISGKHVNEHKQEEHGGEYPEIDGGKKKQKNKTMKRKNKKSKK